MLKIYTKNPLLYTSIVNRFGNTSKLSLEILRKFRLNKMKSYVSINSISLFKSSLFPKITADFPFQYSASLVGRLNRTTYL